MPRKIRLLACLMVLCAVAVLVEPAIAQETAPVDASQDITRLLDQVRAIQIGPLAQQDPPRAAQWLAVGVCIERIKHAEALQDAAWVARARDEADARIAVLNGQAAPADDRMLDLLNLAAAPDAQVVVEYPAVDQAAVTLYCGSIPYAVVYVSRHASEEEARKVLDLGQPDIAPRTKVGSLEDGTPFLAELENWADLGWGEFDPARDFVVLNAPRTAALVAPLGAVDMAQMRGVVVLPDAPSTLRDVVLQRAAEAQVAIVAPADVPTTAGSIVILGDPRGSDLLTGRSAQSALQLTCRPWPNLTAVKGNRRYSVSGLPREAAEQALRLVMRGEAIRPEEADAVRLALVAGLRPSGQGGLVTVPDDWRFYCGDVHTHTFYTDGNESPAALMLQAMHCYLDYAVMTDHNTLQGAQRAEQILRDHGFAFPLVIGEEITNRDWHMNAYPLTSLVQWDTSFYEAAKAAHAQGAAIQWNHPGFPASDYCWTNIPKGLQGTSADAWEHLPDNYSQLQRDGIFPVVTGSTDTHDGTFSWQERTIFFAPALSGADLAEAVRAGTVTSLLPGGAEWLYGPDSLRGKVLAALKDGKGLQQAKARQMQEILANANLAAFIEASEKERMPAE